MKLRDYQEASIDKLMLALKEGSRRTVIQAPTGSGKTVIAAALVNMARNKDKRILFCVPALSLIDQTVDRFRANGIFEIGVIQSQHEMTDGKQPVQICSVQTLARRSIPQADVVIIDECHVMFKVYDKWMADPDWASVPFIGLTATPWAKGMGASGRWDKLIIGTTTQDLIERKHLSDFKCYAPAHPDLSGVKTVLGDYEAKGLGEAMDKGHLVADIVSTWLERGENRSTICFAVNRVHAKHIETQFKEAGVAAEYMDAYTEMEDRTAIIERFASGETRVICNVGVLTTGFDADVRCIILARPTKSEILYTQMIGRGLRTADGKDHCIAKGSKILTDKGEVNIEDVTLDHKVWDGVNWVSHSGAVCRGVQPVIEYAGLIATTDHKVMTDDGWQTIEEAARRQLGVAVTGFGERAIRFSPNHFESYIRFCGSTSCRGHVYEMQEISYGPFLQPSKTTKNSSLPTLQRQKCHQCTEVALSKMSIAATKVSKCALLILRSLWGAWNSIQIQLSKRSGTLDLEQSGASRSSDAIGQDRQQRSLRAGEPPLDGCRCKHEQYSKKQRIKAEVHFIPETLSAHQICGHNVAPNDKFWADRSANCGTVDTTFMYAKREVWDILNAGPLQRFTADGRLVHNCLILDHSDTTLRLGFVTDIHKTELDDGTNKKGAFERPQPKPRECQQCHFLKPPKTVKCPACGFQPVPQNKVETASGDLYELGRGKTIKQNVVEPDTYQRWYSELIRYADLRGYKKGWAYFSFQDKFKQPPPRWLLEYPAQMVSADVDAWIRGRNIRKAIAARYGSHGTAGLARSQARNQRGM